MPLAPMSKMLAHARKNHYAVGYFEAFNMDAMQAILSAAEQADSPIIIGFGGQFLSSPKRAVAEDVYLYGAVALEAARRSRVPTALLLNETNQVPMVYQGMRAGFNAVMYQNPGEDFEQTRRVTREICQAAHCLDIDVESEIGELPMADIATGKQTKGSNTDPDVALEFVEHTGIDALAVAIGNVHLLEEGKSSLDFELLEKLDARSPVPLVLHGGTGVSEGELKKAISLGISKVNIGTAMKRAYINAISGFCRDMDVSRMDPHVTVGWGGQEDMLYCGRAAITAIVLEFIDLFGSSGRVID